MIFREYSDFGLSQCFRECNCRVSAVGDLPPAFEEHLNYLCEQGYQPVTIRDIAEAICSTEANPPERSVSITFDDGMADFLSGAMPILEKFDFSATLFVSTAYVGHTSRWLVREGEAERRMLTWEHMVIPIDNNHDLEWQLTNDC